MTQWGIKKKKKKKITEDLDFLKNEKCVKSIVLFGYWNNNGWMIAEILSEILSITSKVEPCL